MVWEGSPRPGGSSEPRLVRIHSQYRTAQLGVSCPPTVHALYPARFDCWVVLQGCCCPEQVLHFDVNKTIIMCDPVKGVNCE
jgi:hypothetical protein